MGNDINGGLQWIVSWLEGDHNLTSYKWLGTDSFAYDVDIVDQMLEVSVASSVNSCFTHTFSK